MLTYHHLHELLYYSPITGRFWWRPRPREMFNSKRACSVWNARFAGKEAGAVRPDGRTKIVIQGKQYLSYRLAWFHFYGEWPTEEIDHIQRNPCDNRIFMLRESTSSQNKWNTGKRQTNTSGYKGVIWCKQHKKWTARIQAKCQVRHLGFYDDPKEAYQRYCREARKLHGEFAAL